MSGPGRKREVSNGEILRAIALHTDPIVTASEVADVVDMSPQGVNKRLRELAEEGLVIRKKVGANAVVYRLSDSGREEIALS